MIGDGSGTGLYEYAMLRKNSHKGKETKNIIFCCAGEKEKGEKGVYSKLY